MIASRSRCGAAPDVCAAVIDLMVAGRRGKSAYRTHPSSTGRPTPVFPSSEPAVV